MQPQDHSDTTLLVWSDWLEENGEEQKAHDLREEIANPPARRWSLEYWNIGIVGGVGGDSVGGNGTVIAGGNDIIGAHVGGRVDDVGDSDAFHGGTVGGAG